MVSSACASNDHVWRSMPNHGMTPPHQVLLSVQYRYAAGVREILECFFDKKPIREQYLIVKDGQLAGMGAHPYSKGSATVDRKKPPTYKKEIIKTIPQHRLSYLILSYLQQGFSETCIVIIDPHTTTTNSAPLDSLISLTSNL